jgi:hypothetical protein
VEVPKIGRLVRADEEVLFSFAAESVIFRLETVTDQPKENLDEGGRARNFRTSGGAMGTINLCGQKVEKIQIFRQNVRFLGVNVQIICFFMWRCQLGPWPSHS